jgi:hypothetical protein
MAAASYTSFVSQAAAASGLPNKCNILLLIHTIICLCIHLIPRGKLMSNICVTLATPHASICCWLLQQLQKNISCFSHIVLLNFSFFFFFCQRHRPTLFASLRGRGQRIGVARWTLNIFTWAWDDSWMSYVLF